MSLIGPILSLLLFAKIVQLVRREPPHWAQTLSLIVPAGVMVIIALPSVFLDTGYANDSLWTLGWGGRLGVIAISSLGLIAVFGAIAVKSKRMARLPGLLAVPLDIIAGLLIYSVAFWLSPQLFYSFYQIIFPDLPAQIVIKSPLDQDRLRTIIIPAQGGSLADHLAGVGFWAVIPFTLWLHAGRKSQQLYSSGNLRMSKDD